MIEFGSDSVGDRPGNYNASGFRLVETIQAFRAFTLSFSHHTTMKRFVTHLSPTMDKGHGDDI